MNTLPRNISFDRSAIENIRDVPGVVRWLGGFIKEFDLWYAKLFGWTTGFEDLNRSFSSAKVPAVNAPSWNTFKGNLNEWVFGIGDYVEIEPIELLHGYHEGTPIEFHMHWATGGSDIDDRAVKWEIEYTIANMDNPTTTGVGGVFPDTTVVSVEHQIPANTPDRSHMYIDLTVITDGTFKIGALAKLRIRRILSVDDPAPSDSPFGLMVGLHFKKNAIASTTEYKS